MITGRWQFEGGVILRSQNTVKDYMKKVDSGL